MATVKKDLPVLNAVVETGNESIIQSTRLGHEVLAELESLRQGAQTSLAREDYALEDAQVPIASSSALADDPDPDKGSDSNPAEEEQGNLNFDFPGPVEVNAELVNPPSSDEDDRNASDEANDPLLSVAQPTLFNKQRLEDDEIELMIDDVVDRHITELRKDIKRLLERAKNVP